MHSRARTSIFLSICSLLLILLWFPGIKYPVVSDTLLYGLLGRSIWENGMYALPSLPDPKYLPLQAIVSYPFTQVFGLHLGMHVLSLVAGFGVLFVTFFLVRKLLPKEPIVAAAVTLLVTLHPAFILMSMLGSADLLFTFLFLLSLLSFLHAAEDKRWYLAAGITAGLASLTRYNGLPLFVLFILWALWKRRRDLRSSYFWTGTGTGAVLAGLWFVRNTIVFGNPLHTEYTTELAQEAPNLAAQFLENLLYYSNPLHNILPFFFVFALVGLWRHARRYPFLIAAMAAVWILSAFWWVQAVRFFFPGYPLLLFFAVLGAFDVARSLRKPAVAFAALLLLGIASQLPVLCIYTYGECNAWFDRTVGGLPKDLHLTPEGFYAWHQAREFLNAHAEEGATIKYDAPPESAAGIFRSDLRLTDQEDACPVYVIAQRPKERDEVLYQTQDWPVTYVARRGC